MCVELNLKQSETTMADAFCMQSHNPKNRPMLIVGRTKSGKSTVAHKLIAQMKCSNPHIVVHDFKSDNVGWDEKEMRELLMSRFERCVTSVTDDLVWQAVVTPFSEKLMESATFLRLFHIYHMVKIQLIVTATEYFSFLDNVRQQAGAVVFCGDRSTKGDRRIFEEVGQGFESERHFFDYLRAVQSMNGNAIVNNSGKIFTLPRRECAKKRKQSASELKFLKRRKAELKKITPSIGHDVASLLYRACDPSDYDEVQRRLYLIAEAVDDVEEKISNRIQKLTECKKCDKRNECIFCP